MDQKWTTVLLDPVRMKRTINFSDLPDAAAKVKAIPTTYQGMRWTGISYMHKEYVNRSFPRSGYPGAFLSNGSSHVAWLKDEGSLSVQSVDDVFTLVSVTACAAWNDSLQLTFTGHKRSTQVDTHTVILLFGKPQMIFLQWENIDKVVFKAEGGTPHPETGATTSTAIVVMTQLTLSWCFEWDWHIFHHAKSVSLGIWNKLGFDQCRCSYLTQGKQWCVNQTQLIPSWQVISLEKTEWLSRSSSQMYIYRYFLAGQYHIRVGFSTLSADFWWNKEEQRCSQLPSSRITIEWKLAVF